MLNKHRICICICIYTYFLQELIDKVEWQTHTEKLRSLSDTAKLAIENYQSIEVKDLPGVIVYPESTVTEAELEFMQRVASSEALGINKNTLLFQFVK